MTSGYQELLAAAHQVGPQYGVPVAVLMAVAHVETGGTFNPDAVGDNGTSFGDYQEHEHGELGATITPQNVSFAENPMDAVTKAAQTFSAAYKATPNASWGQIAAAAQRPQNPVQYATDVDGLLGVTGPASHTSAQLGSSIPQAISAGGSNVTEATLMSDTTTIAPTTSTAATLPKLGTSGVEPAVSGSSGSALAAGVAMAAPLPDVDAKNFHGYDLTGIPENMLGNAERAIQDYIADPGYEAALNQRISEDYGYSGSWIQKIPQLNAILIWAAADIDTSTAAGQNLFLGAVSNTDWWKTTDQNQRAWQEAQSQDPASAQNALEEAEDKVLATANQVGVDLTKTQLHSIASMYAANSFTPTSILGTQSGTSQEWLDQAVIDTALNVKGSGSVLGGATQVNENYSGGVTDISSTTDPTSLNGIAQQLFSGLQGAAQSYLMYNPGSPTKGLLTNQDLMNYVRQYLGNYTGTGASGLASEFVNNSVQNFTQQMMTQASQFYPSLAPSIAQGTTPANYVAPMSNLISNTLGIDSSAINYTDPNWNWVIATPNAQGQKTALTQDQVLQKITSPGFSWQNPDGSTSTYANTNTAKGQSQDVITALNKSFGFGGA